MDELEVARFSSLPEAEAVAALLRTHGVAARLADNQMLGAAAHLQIALGGVRVVVPDYQIMMARDLVARARRGEFAHAVEPDDIEDDEDDAADRPRGALSSMKTMARVIVITFLAAPLATCLAVALLD